MRALNETKQVLCKSGPVTALVVQWSQYEQARAGLPLDLSKLGKPLDRLAAAPYQGLPCSPAF